MEYKQKVEAFKDSCRMYENEKASQDELSRGNEMLARFIKEDLTFTEETFARILEECGETARQAIYELFVEEKTQLDVAYNMGISRRKLQYLVNQWLHKVFEESE